MFSNKCAHIILFELFFVTFSLPTNIIISGYGDDICLSKLYGIQFYILHVPITESPRTKHTISLPNHSPTSYTRGTLPAGLL
jgi:hypothetical protein